MDKGKGGRYETPKEIRPHDGLFDSLYHPHGRTNLERTPQRRFRTQYRCLSLQMDKGGHQRRTAMSQSLLELRVEEVTQI